MTSIQMSSLNPCNSLSDQTSEEILNLKRVINMLNRVEKMLVPDMQHIPYITQKFIFFCSKANAGKYFISIDVYASKGITMRDVDWTSVENDINTAYREHYGEESILPHKVQAEINLERKKQNDEIDRIRAKEILRDIQSRNGMPMLPGKWRKEPYPPRIYEPIPNYVVSSSVDPIAASKVLNLLETPLNGFLGQAYNYDDHSLTEEWMLTFKDGLSSAPSDDDVIRTQIMSLMEIMIGQVQDRVCTEVGVLNEPPIGLGPLLKEAPVWGIDCYTRRMIELSIADYFMASESLKAPNDNEIIAFIEKKILPSINAQLPNQAHNMWFALNAIVNNPTSSEKEIDMASAVLVSIDKLGIECFKIHPKGTGVICTSERGINPHVVVANYLGELYPPYRWCEKLDVVQQAQKKFGLKPTLPDFYNILLERPRQDPKGYGIMWVDASQRANLGSSCSHSCDPNCTSAVVARNGQLMIALTTTRHVQYGEELSMDYYSITTSETEWRAAICLCGMTSCRGSFLHFATQDDLQQVLTQNCGILWRYSALLRACSGIPVSDLDRASLQRHGMGTASLGEDPPSWILKYAAEILRFIEFERKALPCALLRPKGGVPSQYSYSSADMDARSVMEQRLQSLVCCFSMISRVLEHQPKEEPSETEGMTAMVKNPLQTLPASDAINSIWEIMSTIPQLLRTHLTNLDDVKQGKISEALLSLDTIFSDAKPKGINSLRSSILKIREIIKNIADCENPNARLRLLSDILVFWAHTSNYSSTQNYSPVNSDSLGVLPRELGTNTDNIFSSPNENVYTGSKYYGEKFIFWQLMDWFNAGTDIKETAPDLFGCLQLPTPADCFGHSVKNYSANDRKILINHLKDEKAHMQPWPNSIQTCFSNFQKNSEASDSLAEIKSKKAKSSNKRKQTASDSSDPLETLTTSDCATVTTNASSDSKYVNMSSSNIIGSPFLDVVLGQVDAVIRVIQDIGIHSDTGPNGKSDLDEIQFDNILPPELPTAWVQCENKTCRKWRRVAWNVDVESLPETWECSMNSWDPENATCDAPQDSYDPDRESILCFETSDLDREQFVINSWRDVYCIRNRIYYEAQVKAIKESMNEHNKPVQMIRFHFKGWKPCFDEWIEVGSSRIAPHNLHTNPTKSRNPQAQEILQGIKTVDNPACKPSLSKKSAKSPAKSKICSNKGKKKANKSSPNSVATHVS